MTSMSLSEMAAAVGGKPTGEDVVFSGVGTDSRTLKSGALFVALKGPNFDGHEYLAEARARGAVAALVSRPSGERLPQVQVLDTRVALGQWAAVWRAHHPVPLVGVTGSNGKTTVKEMVAAILERMGRVLATEGNLNNDIGVPLTLLRLETETQFAAVELGANHPGEIAGLTALARPDVALINNAGPAHLAGFGSLEGVARAKGEILEGLSAKGTAVLNRDDPFFPLWRELAGRRRVLSFGVRPGADVWAAGEDIETVFEKQGFATRFRLLAEGDAWEITLPLAGRHAVINALAAATAAFGLGATGAAVKAGLKSVRPIKGRLQYRPGRAGACLIDDSYNANPSSLAVALEVLAACSGERWLVLGDMAELGNRVSALHGELGERAGAQGIERLFAVGEHSREAVRRFGAGARHFRDLRELIDVLGGQMHADVTVLIKGSRSARMERVADALALEENG